VRASSVLEPRHPPGAVTSWASENAALARLPPLPALAARAAALVARHRLGSAVGVHVRAVPLAADIPGVDPAAAYAPAAAATMGWYRAAAAPAHFVPPLVAAAAAAPGRAVLVVADDPAAVAAVRGGVAAAGARLRIVSTTDKGVGAAGGGGNDDGAAAAHCGPGPASAGRSAPCVRAALVDLLALSATAELLGSGWSSFSEAAVRLRAAGVGRLVGGGGGGRWRVRLAGRDFAVGGGAEGGAGAPPPPPRGP